MQVVYEKQLSSSAVAKRPCDASCVSVTELFLLENSSHETKER